MLATVQPMPLIRIPEAFDHHTCLFEVKHDGFRALAYVEGHHYRLVSRRGHVFTKFGVLETEISHGLRADRAVLDGEIVCLDADGRSNFYNLLFRREWPFFGAFDLLAVDGEDLRARPVVERKRRLRRMMPRRVTPPLRRSRRGPRCGPVPPGALVGSRRHRREMAGRALPQRRRADVLIEDQEPRLLADDRSAGAVRAAARPAHPDACEALRSGGVRAAAMSQLNDVTIAPVTLADGYSPQPKD